MSGLPYPLDFRPGWGRNAYADIEWALSVEADAFHRLAFAALAMGGCNLSGYQLPAHDPPVAWHVDHLEESFGMDVLACPGVEAGSVRLLAPGGYLDPAPVTLPAEPGRRP